MVILDTSFLFALFVEQDTAHQKALHLAKSLNQESAFCSFLVFQELMTLMMSKLSAVSASKIGADILAQDSGIQILKIDQEYFEETVDLFESLAPHKLSFVDVSLLILAKNLEAKVLTFDQGLDLALCSQKS